MRFKINFGLQRIGQLLPINYQYELSALIYQLIEAGDPKLAEFIHGQGYTLGKKQFRLFTFSNFYIPKFQVLGDRLRIDSENISLTVSFYLPDAAQSLVMGIFKKQTPMSLGDVISQVNLRIEQIETMPIIPPDEMPIRLRTISPLVVTKAKETAKGKTIGQYLHPYDLDYSQYFFKNLLNKYNSLVKHGLAAPIDLKHRVLKFEPLTPREKVRKQGVLIKAHTPQQTKIIGYKYDFALTAPLPLIKLGMLAGFGNNNAVGFGATREPFPEKKEAFRQQKSRGYSHPKAKRPPKTHY